MLKITLTPTDAEVLINGVPARIWQGATESGIACHAYITRIGVQDALDSSEFERELKATEPLRPELAAVIPARLVL